MRYAFFLSLLLVFCIVIQPAHAAAVTGASDSTILGAWRWVEDAMAWLKGIGLDRSRLVQIWLLFMLIGLYIIMRIKPRA